MSHANGPRTGRPPVLAGRGRVSTPHDRASASGLDALRRGGSAVDAAIAVNATLCVVYPHMAGLGGDGFWLIAGPGTGGVQALDASGPAARMATRDHFRKHGCTDAIPARGPLAALTTPLQTTVVAHLVSVTNPTASEHLTVLRDAGLIDSSRAGRTVTHELTAAGRAVLDAAPTHR